MADEVLETLKVPKTFFEQSDSLLSPFLGVHGFHAVKDERVDWGVARTYQCADRCLRIIVNTHWHDIPSYANVELWIGADGALTLWQLAQLEDSECKDGEYLISGWTVRDLLERIKIDLVKLQSDFLSGDAREFLELAAKWKAAKQQGFDDRRARALSNDPYDLNS